MDETQKVALLLARKEWDVLRAPRPHLLMWEELHEDQQNEFAKGWFNTAREIITLIDASRL